MLKNKQKILLAKVKSEGSNGFPLFYFSSAEISCRKFVRMLELELLIVSFCTKIFLASNASSTQFGKNAKIWKAIAINNEASYKKEAFPSLRGALKPLNDYQIQRCTAKLWKRKEKWEFTNSVMKMNYYVFLCIFTVSSSY